MESILTTSRWAKVVVATHCFSVECTPERHPMSPPGLPEQAGIPLKIAAKMSEPEERAYFEAMVRPLLGSDVTYIGEVDRQTKLELLGGAECLLNPIAWPEPFGMVMIEALACGTPVLTTRLGAAPEIVEDGTVGFLRSDEGGLVTALGRVHEIDRTACRERIEERFSVELMVENHIAVYEQAISDVSRSRSHDLVVAGAA